MIGMFCGLLDGSAQKYKDEHGIDQLARYGTVAHQQELMNEDQLQKTRRQLGGSRG